MHSDISEKTYTTLPDSLIPEYMASISFVSRKFWIGINNMCLQWLNQPALAKSTNHQIHCLLFLLTVPWVGDDSYQLQKSYYCKRNHIRYPKIWEANFNLITTQYYSGMQYGIEKRALELSIPGFTSQLVFPTGWLWASPLAPPSLLTSLSSLHLKKGIIPPSSQCHSGINLDVLLKAPVHFLAHNKYQLPSSFPRSFQKISVWINSGCQVWLLFILCSLATCQKVLDSY